MEFFNVKALFWSILLVSMVALVSSDFSKDKTECQEQLITLSPCLNYVAGEARAPSSQCCKVLYEKIKKTKKCLCILVKDRNEPSLGLKLNATRALSLPTLCHVNSSALDCLPLLSLAPNSSEAQVFIQFANTPQADDNEPVSSRSDAEKHMGMFDVFLSWCLVLAFVATL